VKFSGKVGKIASEQMIKVGGDPDHRLDTWIVFRIRHYWEIRKVVDGHKPIRQMAGLTSRHW